LNIVGTMVLIKIQDSTWLGTLNS